MAVALNNKFALSLLAIAAGALSTLAFAPYGIWPLAILSVLIFLLLIEQRSVKQAAWLGWLWGLGSFATGISWVHVSIDTFGGMPKIASLFLMSLLVSYLALYPALFAGITNRFFSRQNLSRYALAVPVLWLIADWLRGWVMTGFPWLVMGYSQIDSPLGNFAPLGGVDLVTFAIVMMASLFTCMIVTKRWTLAIAPAVIFATGYGLNSAHWVTPNPASKTSFALVQGNIDQASKWLPSERWPTIIKYTDLTKKHREADIIIWPEAAIPAFEYEIASYLANLDALVKEYDSAMITGVINRSNEGQYYNSVLAIGQTDGSDYSYDPEDRYHKHHLLPFGEFVPFEDILRPLAPFFNLPMSSFSRGAYIQPNVVANGKHFAAALCYEIIFNEQIRKNVNDDTDFILTLSNDAWFGDSIGPQQHMEIARMRALELGKPVIRSTNNGVTAITDYRGKIIAQIPQFETAVLTAEVTSTDGQTPYHGVGRWPLYIWSVLSLIIGFGIRRKASR
ncbi:apolipoprotein N-acyltransferase [Vibrio agarivorans]|uniref:Apolipoprotein N-acyltransferase n=1 Tax=Vibrio agarivorans TaxID=153622 RepID=A0ABT7Y1B6_9VIBR|nr:apolipoprotein N-acyltransferase [Vibrio agarivorans]MDN2481775.1 apolipoprotein N-acyltransferase [Vibrio agarivorans]